MKIRNSIRSLSLVVAAALLGLAFAQTDEDMVNPPPGEWPQFGRDTLAHRYSPLDQINKENVSELQIAFVRDMGYRQSFQGGPTVWDGVMYVSTQTGVMALDATDGTTLWEYSSPNEGEAISDSDR